MTWGKCRQFMWLFPLSFIGQFVYPVERRGWGERRRGLGVDRDFILLQILFHWNT